MNPDPREAAILRETIADLLDAFDAQGAALASERQVRAVRDRQLEDARRAFTELCDRVGDFKTAHSGEEGWRIIPDMLAAMEDELVVARAFLAGLDVQEAGQ